MTNNFVKFDDLEAEVDNVDGRLISVRSKKRAKNKSFLANLSMIGDAIQGIINPKTGVLEKLATIEIVGNQVDPYSSTSVSQQLQNIHDALPNIGGAIAIAPKSLSTETPFDWTTAVTFTKPIKLYSNYPTGGAVTNAQTPALNMRVASGITALTIGNGTPLFGGALLDGLRWTSVDGTGRAILVSNMSNVFIDKTTIAGFTTGTGIEFTGSAGQYSRIRDTYIHGTRTGIRVTDYNGGIIDGCYIDPANNGATPITSSIGVLITNSNADTWCINNTQIQGAETCIDSFGAYMRVDNCRFEAFTSGILLKGDRQVVTSSNSFNNFIHNGAGICVDIQSTATFADVDKYIYGSVSNEPTRDASSATNTHRRDGVILNRAFDTISATTNFIIGGVPRNALNSIFNARYARLHIGDTTIPASGTDYWQLALFRAHSGGNQGIGNVINSIGGWTTPQLISFDMSVNNNVLNGGNERVRAIFTKVGNPPNLLNPSINLMLVPY